MKIAVLPVRKLFFYLVVTFFVKPSFGADAHWVEVKSPHFIVATDAGEKRGREVALRFEQMRAVFTMLVPKARVNSAIPLQIVAFRNTEELQGFAPLWQGKPTEMSGLFMKSEDRSFILLDMSVKNPYSVVFHEYAHQLLNAMVSRPMELWYEEGFAEFFSSTVVGDKDAKVGKIPDYTYILLRQNGLISVSSLFRTRQNSPTYNESGDHRNVFYLESWMVVHYLYDNHLIPQLNAYFNAVSRNVSVEGALQQAFGMSASQFDKTMHDYVWDGHYKSYVVPSPPGIVSSGFTAARLGDTEVATLTADIHLISPDYLEKAASEFQEVLRTSPNNVDANRGLGYARLRQKRFDDAKGYFRAAEQLDTKDPRIHFYLALLMSHNGAFEKGLDLQEIAKELEAATTLDPEYAEAYLLLGFTRAHEGKLDQATGAMEKAAALKPHDPGYQLNLAEVYISCHKFEQAQAVLHGLENSSNLEIAVQAKKSLAQIQQMAKAAADAPPASSEADHADDDKDQPPRLKHRE
jgi:Flp pilus assembly protein TadD